MSSNSSDRSNPTSDPPSPSPDAEASNPAQTQPWKAYLELEKAEKVNSPATATKKPWLTWEPTPEDPSYKPWLTWNPNIDNGDIDPNKKIIKTHVMGGCPSKKT